MPESKLSGILDKEHPWIRRELRGRVNAVYFYTAGRDILSKSPITVEEGPMGIMHPEEITLRSQDGRVVVKDQVAVSKKFWLFGPKVFRVKKVYGEVNHRQNVGEVVKNLGDQADTIKYVVYYYRESGVVIINKIPLKTSIKVWASGMGPAVA
jgi:hypothetical protein